MPENKAIGKIGGGMFILILIILFIAAHGGSNEMMYVTLLFVFIVIALFSYGFWSAVNKGEGIWQYMGKHDLQHQQISNPNYHFGNGSVRNYKSHPQKNVHICAPPKMGGARLNIYTIPMNNSLQRIPSFSSQHRPMARNMSTNRSHRNHQSRGSFRRKQESIDEQIKVEVYPEEHQKPFEEIQIAVPSNIAKKS